MSCKSEESHIMDGIQVLKSSTGNLFLKITHFKCLKCDACVCEHQEVEGFEAIKCPLPLLDKKLPSNISKFLTIYQNFMHTPVEDLNYDKTDILQERAIFLVQIRKHEKFLPEFFFAQLGASITDMELIRDWLNQIDEIPLNNLYSFTQQIRPDLKLLAVEVSLEAIFFHTA